VSDRYPGTESCDVTGSHQYLARSFDHCDLTIKDIDHLVFSAMPMLDRGSAARLKDLNERSELRKLSGLTNPECLIRVGGALHLVDLGD
jgi:hypothetical protein